VGLHGDEMILDHCRPLLGYERPQMQIWNMSFEALHHATILRDPHRSERGATGLAHPTMPHLWSWSCRGRISAIGLLFAYSNHLVIAPARFLEVGIERIPDFYLSFWHAFLCIYVFFSYDTTTLFRLLHLIHEDHYHGWFWLFF
jgi:hypothetical protein